MEQRATQSSGMAIEVGTVVRDRLWGGTHSGTVTAADAGSVFVAWHGTCVEGQLGTGDVEVWADPPAGRGGIGVLGADGTLSVAPTGDRP